LRQYLRGEEGNYFELSQDKNVRINSQAMINGLSKQAEKMAT